MYYSSIRTLTFSNGKDEPQSPDIKEKYLAYLHNLLEFSTVQAKGFPTENHALFQKYNIEAMTIAGSSNTDGYASVNIFQIAT